MGGGTARAGRWLGSRVRPARDAAFRASCSEAAREGGRVFGEAGND